MLISFVVPVYNAGDYLRPCVQSLIEQSHQEIEVVLIDDGSIDGSAELCDELANQDSRIRVYHKENGGVHTARNLGIREARGEYLIFVDADDWIDDKTAERVAEIICKENPDIVRFTYVREFGNISVKKKNIFVLPGLSVGADCRKVYRQTMGLVGQELSNPEYFNFLATTCTSAYRKSLLCEHNIEFEPREPIGSFEDGLFNLKVMMRAKSFYFMDDAFYHYRKTNMESCTANYREKYLSKQTYLFQQLYQIAISERDTEFLEAFHNRVNFSNLELCLNAVKSEKSWSKQSREIKQILSSPIHNQARRYLKLKFFSTKWKVYFFLVKYHMTIPLFVMTKIVRALQKKR